jgi:hypothetical protein
MQKFLSSSAVWTGQLLLWKFHMFGFVEDDFVRRLDLLPCLTGRVKESRECNYSACGKTTGRVEFTPRRLPEFSTRLVIRTIINGQWHATGVVTSGLDNLSINFFMGKFFFSQKRNRDRCKTRYGKKKKPNATRSQGVEFSVIASKSSLSLSQWIRIDRNRCICKRLLDFGRSREGKRTRSRERNKGKGWKTHLVQSRALLSDANGAAELSVSADCRSSRTGTGREEAGYISRTNTLLQSLSPLTPNSSRTCRPSHSLIHHPTTRAPLEAMPLTSVYPGV